MTAFDLTEFYTLYGEGLAIGIVVAFFPFIVGFAVQSILSIVKKA